MAKRYIGCIKGKLVFGNMKGKKRNFTFYVLHGPNQYINSVSLRPNHNIDEGINARNTY